VIVYVTVKVSFVASVRWVNRTSWPMTPLETAVNRADFCTACEEPV
jgi:hypothetical protein